MKRAFSLAEVLIVLFVIGVIAVLAIPNIIWTVQKMDLTSKFTKNYSALSTSVKKSESIEGNFSNWNWISGEQIFNDYFEGQFSTLRICAPGEEGCGDAEYTYLNGTRVDNPFPDNLFRFITADGAKWVIGINQNCLSSKQYCALFRVDINGDSGPNSYGRDVFTFFLLPYTNEIRVEGLYNYPSQYDETDGWSKKSTAEIENDCSKTGGGTLCGAKILLDGYKMNY